MEDWKNGKDTGGRGRIHVNPWLLGDHEAKKQSKTVTYFFK